MLLADYADWVEREVTKRKPHAHVRKWVKQWDKTLTALRKHGPYEHLSIIVARWEFLGGLYAGVGDTNARHARDWVVKFLHPVRAAYSTVHNLSGTAQPHESEFFSVYRNKPMHGYTPAAVFVAPDNVIGWWVSSKPHLGRTTRGSLRISSSVLQRDLENSMEEFAVYLKANTGSPVPPKDPRDLFCRSFWMRFQPHGYGEKVWETEGRKRTVFT
jgi:hypothetical protein